MDASLRFARLLALSLAAALPAQASPVLATPATPSVAPRGETQIDFEKAARNFLAARGVRDPAPDGLELEPLVEKHFVRARLGAFEVVFPNSGLAQRSEDLKLAAQALLEAHGRWFDWLKPAGRDQKAHREDLATLLAWVKSWKTPALTKLAAQDGGDLGKLLGASDAVKAALERFEAAMQRGEAIGAARETPQRLRLYLLPTRRDFVEFMAVIGWLQPDQRANYWLDAAADWSQAHYNSDQIIALEYSVPNRPAGVYDQGMGMGKDDPTLLQQQVVQLALNELFDTLYQGRVPGAFVQGLSMNLVIDQFGEINTRIDGDLRARVTGKREVFVPGGNKDGGLLTKNSADTRWRAERGKDHWFKLLRQSQKEGEELDRAAKNRAALFAVRSDDGGKRELVRAPFLGSAAVATKVPPEAFAGDFAEFLRAYKSAFIHWLQSKALNSEKPSREAFARLIAKLGDSGASGDFESVFAELYSKQPLSNAECDKDCLEGEFLLWLQRQK
ncbi:MAG: hypothetical protein IPJ77_12665 [Planctomycetes bacterium]|nr:hypothetical protein [Planctomycetota bacterium]